MSPKWNQHEHLQSQQPYTKLLSFAYYISHFMMPWMSICILRFDETLLKRAKWLNKTTPLAVYLDGNL